MGVHSLVVFVTDSVHYLLVPINYMPSSLIFIVAQE